jgi:hypothetical protein
LKEAFEFLNKDALEKFGCLTKESRGVFNGKTTAVMCD